MVTVPALPDTLIPAVPAEMLAAVRLVRLAPETAPKSPLQVPLVMVPTDARLASVVRFGSVVVALRRLSKRMLVQYKLLPSARAVVVVPAITFATRLLVKKRFVLPSRTASVVVPARSFAKRLVE